MSALAAARSTLKRGEEPVNNFLGLPAAAAVTLFAGALAAVDNAGNARPARVSTTDRIIGRVRSTVDNSGGAAGDLSAEIEQGVFRWENSAGADEIAADDIGKPCYAVDDQTVALTDGTATRTVAGIIVGVDSTGVWVESRLSLSAALS